jgi:hypothetical protein
MTALRMSQGPEVLMSNFASGIENSQAKSSQQASATSYNNSRSRRQASRAAATMYSDQGDFGLLTPQQPPAMTRVSPSPPPTSASSARVDKQQAHSLTVQVAFYQYLFAKQQILFFILYAQICSFFATAYLNLLGVKGVDTDETCEGGSWPGIEQYKHFH